MLGCRQTGVQVLLEGVEGVVAVGWLYVKGVAHNGVGLTRAGGGLESKDRGSPGKMGFRLKAVTETAMAQPAGLPCRRGTHSFHSPVSGSFYKPMYLLCAHVCPARSPSESPDRHRCCESHYEPRLL